MSVRLRFDFADPSGRVTTRIFEKPVAVIEATRLADVVPALAAAEAARAAGRFVAGAVAYEAAPAFDAALATRPPGPLPLAWFAVFDAPIDPGPEVDPDITKIRVDAGNAWTADVTPAAHAAAIARVRAAIAAGDSYQANYTFRLRSRLDVATLAARYAHLRAAHRVPFAAHLDMGRWQILSLSPELFFHLHGRTLTTRPMKGTMPRGRFEAEDTVHAEALRSSAKNRAENVMIVDLMRNDLGRIAEIGSVAVPSIFDVERYRSVFQMTSTVTGQVRPGTTVVDIFKALFPAGSITGAPKTSSMRLIADLEPAPRGVYCGAIGLLAPDGGTTFNVAIRTAVVDAASGEAEYGVGGGITWDSTPGDEYAEAISKAGFLDPVPACSLIETLRLDDGRLVRRDGHLARLARSARYFDIPFDRTRIDAALDAHTRDRAHGRHRVRLTLAPAGEVAVESRPFVLHDHAADPPRRVPTVLARHPIASADIWLFHKTTRRTVYDAHCAAHPDAFDVLLWNERRELTEFTIGNVVVEFEGRRVTPPVTCGLLAGVFREALLDAGVIAERIVTIDDLARASRAWLVNSLREWVEVEVK